VAKRFDIPPIPKGDIAQYSTNPYARQTIYGYYPGLFNDQSPTNLVVRPNDDLLIQKGGISALIVYQRLLFDPNVQSAWMKVLQEITSRDLVVDSASDLPGDIAVKEFVEEELKDLPMDEIFRGMLEAYIVGFSVGEVMWRRSAAGVKAYDVRPRDPRRFLFAVDEKADMGFSMKMVTYANTLVGEDLPARKFIVFRYWTQSNGDPYGCGLGRTLYPIVKFKRRALESQLLYSDRYANPTAVAKAPLAATTQEIDALYNHLVNLSQETALILPEGYDLEFINPQGSPDTFTQLRESLVKEINMLVSGEDETGNAEAGSRASSEVALQVREVRAKELGELLCETLNETLVRWIVDLNFGTNVVAPKVRRDFKIDEGSKLTMGDVSILISQVGYRPTKEWIKTTYKVELEEKEDAVAAEEEVMLPSETETAPEEEQSDSALDEEISKLEAELETEPPEEESEDDEVLDELLSDLETAPESDESEDDELNKLIAEIETK
jgi:phage gp29-like protein